MSSVVKITDKGVVSIVENSELRIEGGKVLLKSGNILFEDGETLEQKISNLEKDNRVYEGTISAIQIEVINLNKEEK